MAAINPPAQTAKRRKVTYRWSRHLGLNPREHAAAEALRVELEANPEMRFIPWGEVLGSNEWKMQVWRSVTTDAIATVEIIIGKALPD